jgi:hypothetical protein
MQVEGITSHGVTLEPDQFSAVGKLVARKILIAAWHMLSRNQPFKPAPRSTAGDSVPASSRLALAARRPLTELRSRDSSHRHGVRAKRQERDDHPTVGSASGGERATMT